MEHTAPSARAVDVGCFPTVARYLSLRLGTDLRQGHGNTITVVESPLRLQRELSYGYIRVAWLVALDAGPILLSVPPGATAAIKTLLAGRALDVDDESLPAALTGAIAPALRHHGIATPDRAFRDVLHACNRSTWRPHLLPDTLRLRSGDIPPAEGLALPVQCFPDGLAFGVVREQQVVCCAWAHRTGLLEDSLADLGVVTAPAYRRRGFARSAVSAVAGEMIARNGEAHYACAPQNAASLATAASVGFLRYARSLILGSPSTPQ